MTHQGLYEKENYMPKISNYTSNKKAPKQPAKKIYPVNNNYGSVPSAK